jgi:hypothetical protein
MEFKQMRGVPQDYIGIVINDQHFVVYSNKSYTPKHTKYIAQRIMSGIYESRNWFVAGVLLHKGEQ